jgi:hypothetical protein
MTFSPKAHFEQRLWRRLDSNVRHGGGHVNAYSIPEIQISGPCVE